MSGQIADSVQVAREMKSARGDDKKLLSQPNERPHNKSAASLLVVCTVIQPVRKTSRRWNLNTALNTLHETVLKEVGNSLRRIKKLESNKCDVIRNTYLF